MKIQAKTRTIAGMAAAFIALAAHSGVASADDPEIKFEKYTLENGLEVILHQDNSVPIVAVNVWYHVGSGDEDPGRSGFAHLFEHMLFQGSEHVGEDRHFEVLKSVGATGVNGTTNTDRTNYFEVVPSNEIEVGLWLESDRMGYFLPTVTKKSLDNQIEVVRNERRQRVDNVPYGRHSAQDLGDDVPRGTIRTDSVSSVITPSSPLGRSRMCRTSIASGMSRPTRR